jgi:hypothetical protein
MTLDSFDDFINESKSTSLDVYKMLRTQLGLQPINRAGKQPFYIQKPNQENPDKVLAFMKDADWRDSPRGSVVRGTWGDTCIWQIDTGDPKNIIFDLIVPTYRNVNIATDPEYKVKDIQNLIDNLNKK